MTQQLAAPPATVPRTREPVDRRLHRGWALMLVSGVVAAAANLALLTGGGGGVEVIAVTGEVAPGTPVGQLGTRVVTLADTDVAAMNLLTPEQLGRDVAGMVTTTRLADGDLLRHGDLVAAADSTTAAMSIPVDPARAVGGALTAGDRIDVLAERDGRVVVIVEDAEVLDVLDPGGGLGTVSGMALTIAVEPGDAVALSTALRHSEIDIVRAARAGG